MNRLAGKTVLVTGAARGLGAAIAQRMSEEGATVIVNDINAEAAREQATKIGGHAVAADVANSKEVSAMFIEVARLAPRLDILVNNAGISGMEGRSESEVHQSMTRRKKLADEIASGGPIETFVDVTMNTPDELWRRMQAVHVDGTFHVTREALKLMSPRMAGSIINMSSIMGTSGRPGYVAYSTAKAAVLGFTRALAHEIAPRRIRVNAIAPGWIDTDFIAAMKPLHAGLIAQTPLHRLGDPDDVAWAAVYLASDESKFLTGQVISPNGGWHMSQ